MSRIYKLLRQTENDRIEAELAGNKKNCKDMDISEIKKKILEKIEKEKADSSGREKAALSILSEKIGPETVLPPPPAADTMVSAETERLEKEYAEKLALAESENKKLKDLHESALRRNDDLVLQLKERTGTISELEKRLAEEFDEIRKEKEKAVTNVDTLRSKVYSTGKEVRERSSRINQLEEALKVKEKKLAEVDKLCKNLENINNENEAQLKSYEKEAKELRGQVSHLADELEVKNSALAKIEMTYKTIATAKSEAESRLRALEKDNKGLEEKVSRFIDELADADKKIAEKDRSYRTIEIARKEAELKCEPLERDNKDLDGKVSQLTEELSAKDKRLDELERSNREIDDIAREASFRLHALEREKIELEEKTSALSLEFETITRKYELDRTVALENINKFRSELDTAKHIINEKEKDEIDLREALSQAVAGVDSRDKKIEADMKYYEKLIKEIKDLRQELRNINSRQNNPRI